MKVAIIILGNSWICPYVNIYKDFLEKSGVEYDVILWDRDGSDSNGHTRQCEKGKICFDTGNMNLGNPLLKMFAYVKYARFIKRTVCANEYDRLILSGPHLAILLSSFLKKKYKGRYILDYRDISVEQYPFLSRLYADALSGSYGNVISSPGFKKYLPTRYDYFVSHNFNVYKAKKALSSPSGWSGADEPLDILTIGAIRNYDSNVKILQSLANNGSYRLRFVGSGEASPLLAEYARENNIENVEFSGFYKKEDEESLVAECDFINIYFPDNVEHSSIMSNRFYLSLMYKKPMIVTAGSIQAALVEKYGLGIVIGETQELDAEIRNFISAFDYEKYVTESNRLLAAFVEEHECLEKLVAGFVGVKQ